MLQSKIVFVKSWPAAEQNIASMPDSSNKKRSLQDNGDDVGTASTIKVKRTRRRHKNSKLGCTSCKKRQIKCDEALPACMNCRRRNDVCSFMFLSYIEFQKLILAKIESGDDGNGRDLSMGAEARGDVDEESVDNDTDTEDRARFLTELGNKRPGVGIARPQEMDNSMSSRTSPEDVQREAISANMIQSYTNDVLANHLNRFPYDDMSSITTDSPNGLVMESLPDQPYVKYVVQEATGDRDNFLQTPDRLFDSLVDTNMDRSFALTPRLESVLEFDSNLLKDADDKNVEAGRKDIHDQIDEAAADKPGEYENRALRSDDEESLFDISKYKHKLSRENDYMLKFPGFYSDSATASHPQVNYNQDQNQNENRDRHNAGHMFPSTTGSPQSPYIDSDGPLPGARCADKTFKLIHELPMNIVPIVEKTIDLVAHFESNTLREFFMKYGPCDVDDLLVVGFRMYFPFLTLFSKLIRKSLLLFVADAVKNTLCTQKPILSSLSDEMRVRICGVCERYSVNQLSELTLLINHQYITRFPTFTRAQREMLLCAFITLASSTIYHYNSGYRQVISVRQSKQCTKFIGTFAAGIFSLMISESEREKSDRAMIIQGYIKFILLEEKYIIVPNKSPHLIIELYDLLKSLNLDKEKDYNLRPWASSYMNLCIFLDKHIQFLVVFKDRSLIGFDHGYVIRMINEWYQLFPYDLVNLTKLRPQLDIDNLKVRTDNDFEIKVVIELTYVALKQCLQACIPGVRSLVRNSFVGTESLDYDKIPHLMKSLRLLRKREYKVYAIHAIRTFAFLRARNEKLKMMLAPLEITPFKSGKELSLSQRCEQLLNDWKYGNIFKEAKKDSLTIRGGNYITADNFPTYNLNRELANMDPAMGEAIKFKSVAEMIKDFEFTNTGFFSKDYDSKNDPPLDALYKAAEEHGFVFADTEDNCGPDVLRNSWNIENFIKLGE